MADARTTGVQEQVGNRRLDGLDRCTDCAECEHIEREHTERTRLALGELYQTRDCGGSLLRAPAGQDDLADAWRL